MEHFINTFLNSVSNHGNDPAVSDEVSSFSYEQLFDYGKTVSANLIAKGVKRGSRIIVEISRRKEYAGCLLGCWFAGAVAIPLSDDYPEERLEYIKKDSEYELSIDEDFIQNMDMSLKADPIITDMEDEGIVIYTSGSTGNPKGVIHDYYSMAAVVERNTANENNEKTERNNVVGLVASFTFIVGISHFLSAMAMAKHLVLVPDEIRRDPYKLAAYYDENNIESSYVPPRMVDFMLKHNKSLKLISVGSERITNVFFDNHPVVVNGYGATEIFGGTLGFKIDKKYENTPIGKPVGNEKAYVLDENNNEVETGELCISGYVAKGYLNREKETKKSFIKNPFKETDGFDRMFRTGDIVQRLPDGNLVFIERKDWMIKINGQRVEPLEVESAIRRISGIKEAAIKDFTAKNGITYLAAYYVCGEDVTQEQVSEFCKANLTSYMVPSFYFRMDELPVNPNGKLDRKNLPEPDISSFKNEYAAPENKIEESICTAIETVLECGRIGRNDDFFLLGGDSVKAMEAVNILDDLPVDTEMFFRGRTSAGIADIIANGGADEPAFERVSKSEYPLTSSQLGVYLDVEKNPDSLMYNNPIRISLDSDVDSEKLIAAVDRAVNNHKAYHCSIEVRHGFPCMVPDDIQFHTERRNCDSIETALKDFVRPFDLESGMLIRACLFENDTDKVLALDAHHIVFDGTTLSVLLKEISKVYEGRDIYEERTSAFDLSTYEEVLKTSDRYIKAKEFFDNQYRDVDYSNDFPCDYEDKGTASLETVNLSMTLNKEVLLKFLKSNGLTENSLFLAAFAFVLAKYNGTDKSMVSVGENGRHTSMTFNTAGMLVKTLVLPVDLMTENSIPAFISGLQETFRNSVENDIYPFSELAGEYNPDREFSFVFQGDNFSTLKLDDKKYSVLGIQNTDAINKLTLMVFSSDDSYRLSFRYRSDLYSGEIMQAFADAYVCAVNEFLDKELLSEVELVSEEQLRLLDSFCRDEEEYGSKTVPEYFEEWTHKQPEHDLAVYKDRHISYKLAGEITDRIAGHIISLGMKRNDVVAVLIPRNEWIVLATYGVLKSGCAYEPLDSAYPSERLSFMVENAGAGLLITTHELEGMIKNYSGKKLFIEDIPDLPPVPKTVIKNEPDDLYILLYTSGTTGTPKGVQITHRNAVSLAHTTGKLFGLDTDTVNACYASYGFDACMMDLTTIPVHGGTIHIIPEEMRLDLKVIDEYYTENKVTHAFMTTQVGRQFALLTGSPYLKYLFLGGEALVPLDTEDLAFDIYNGYGPTECVAYVAAYKAAGHPLRIPIGRINPNLKGYIVDKNFNRLPVGAPGELLIAGAQVSKGYLNLPEKTEEAYLDNPFSDDEAYRKVYRTGDTVRYLPDGLLDFIGRHDGQVKIRGFRVELTEVEEIIRRFDGIRDATVAAFTDPSGGRYLTAYVVSDSRVDTEALNAFIRSEKPLYMVPAAVMQLDAIPLNQNQKVNRKALPVPEFSYGDVIPPETELQKKIFDIIAGITGHKGFGIDTDIFEAGLTSIGSVRLNVELADEFGVPVRIADLSENRTVRALEAFINDSSESEEYEIYEDYPVTQTQSGIFAECSMDGNSVAYNIPVLFRIRDGVDCEKLAESLKETLNAHPYTKMTLKMSDSGEIRAVRHDDAEISVDIIKCSAKPEISDLVKPFKLLNAPLYRLAIYKTEEGNYLFADFHHILADGTSETVIFADMQKVYSGKAVKKEKYTCYELALDEEKNRASDLYEKAAEYYDSILNGCDADCIPAKCPETSTVESGSVTEELGIDMNAVNEFCRADNLTKNAFFNAAFALTFSRFMNREQVVYTTIYNGRSDSRLDRAVGMLVKTLPVTASADAGTTVRDFSVAIGKQILDSMVNDTFSFAEISEKYGIRADIMFVYQDETFTNDAINNDIAEIEKAAAEEAKEPISVEVIIKNGTVSVRANYRKDYFNREFIGALIAGFECACRSMLKTELVKDIDICSEKSMAFIGAMNATEKNFRRVPIHRLFEKQAKENPDRTAVTAAGSSYSFRELNEHANRIAHSLIESGIRKDDIVGIILDRTVDIAAAQLGIMKAGGAFLPMLPDYPDDRIEYCIADAECPAVITSEAYIESGKEMFARVPECRPISLEELYGNEDTSDPDIDIAMDSLAYCIYTSGSTGVPKGVMIEHHSLSSFIQTSAASTEMYPLMTEDGSGICISSVSFDMSILQIYCPLTLGYTLCMAAEDEIHNPLQFIELMQKNHVQTMICTPSFMSNMIDIPEFIPVLKNLKSVMMGAEAFPSGLFDRIREISEDIVILNGYGPTETTVSSSAKILSDGRNITIGGPGGNYRYYVMDKSGHIQPEYAYGELIICGEGVGRGYVNLPDKTEASFFELNGCRAYHSGDMVRINKDAEIEFFGRTDNQVKLRGFRVELDEIENQICAFDDIRQSKVIVRNNGSEDFLAAFFTADHPVDIDALILHLKSKLTNYMIPAAIMQIDKMPLNASGKIDKNALPEVTAAKRRHGRKSSPKKELEKELCELFKDVLKADEYYPDDDFFEMGGTSLSASKIVMTLMSKGYKVQYQDMFENPTPEMLAEFIEGTGHSEASEEKDSDSQDVRSVYPEQLKFNTLEYAGDVVREPLGTVLLTGAVGFLGIHILRELLERDEGDIICLIRRGSFATPERRLRSMLIYYFDDPFDELVEKRVKVLEADVTDNVAEVLKDIDFDTVINCAACVKHYAADDILERINVHGVENMIQATKEKNARMIQISTVSIAGAHTDETWKRRVKMYENGLFVIDDMGNKYGISKYHAELRMLEAIKGGMRGKIIRVGNLMGRHKDGEFQINFNTNAFMNALKGFAAIGKSPISHGTDRMSFSPIDMTAKAVVLLAGTNDKFTAFNTDNRFIFDEWQLIEAANKCGISITPVPDEEYYSDYYRMLGDESANAKLQGLMTNDRPDIHGVELDNTFTTNILYRLGFSWPLPDIGYLERTLESLMTLDYFEDEE